MKENSENCIGFWRTDQSFKDSDFCEKLWFLQ